MYVRQFNKHEVSNKNKYGRYLLFSLSIYLWFIDSALAWHVLISNYCLISNQFVRFGLVILFNVTMWGCYVNSLKALSSLQATVTNFATNFLSSGLAGFFLFEEALSFQVYNRLLAHGCFNNKFNMLYMQCYLLCMQMMNARDNLF